MSSLSMNQDIKFVNKGWGFEKWITNSEKYCGKLLYFVKDKCCSYHYHKIKTETFYLQSGSIKLLYGMNDDFSKASYTYLRPGDKFEIPPGMRHMMIAIEDSELFEFSTQHFEEDSYRIIKGD
jgi:mannose-6-phosphate isomerase-like protein (cupin superfamily)